MSQTQGKDEKKANAKADMTGAMPKVKWDESRMVSSYANVCNVASTREEVTVIFGTNQTWQTGQPELTVELSNRIILNPFAAKRLSILLNRVVADYEGRFGELRIEAERAAGAPAKKG